MPRRYEGGKVVSSTQHSLYETGRDDLMIQSVKIALDGAMLRAAPNGFSQPPHLVDSLISAARGKIGWRQVYNLILLRLRRNYR